MKNHWCFRSLPNNCARSDQLAKGRLGLQMGNYQPMRKDPYYKGNYFSMHRFPVKLVLTQRSSVSRPAALFKTIKNRTPIFATESMAEIEGRPAEILLQMCKLICRKCVLFNCVLHSAGFSVRNQAQKVTGQLFWFQFPLERCRGGLWVNCTWILVHDSDFRQILARLCEHRLMHDRGSSSKSPWWRN